MKLSILSSPFGRAVTVIVAAVLVTVPYTRVIATRVMIVEALLVAIALVLIGVLVRGLTHRFRGAGRVPVTVVAQLLILVLIVTARGFSRGALLGIVPRWQTVVSMAVAMREAVRQIVTGVAPLDETIELHVLFLFGIGAFAIALYALLVWGRSPIPATVLTVGVGALPSIVVGYPISTGWFIALAVVTLVMFWQCVPGAGAGRPAGAGSALVIGAIAVAGALTVSNLTLPASLSVGGGPGGGYELDASLELGEGLRQPSPVTALTYVTRGEAPYLRIGTLSAFDGAVWHPDEGPTDPLHNPIMASGDNGYFDSSNSLTITIERAQGDRLPVPYMVTSVEGLDGNWRVLPDNHTVQGEEIRGTTYEATYRSVQPALEEIRAANTMPPAGQIGTRAIPAATPSSMHEVAMRMLNQENTDIDRLLALETWFRSEFTYSLDPPIADESNIDVLAAFLEERSGYCVHFASAFAVIARTMGMPARVVIGFLPGEQTGTSADGTRYRVSTDQLHAWPEVHFAGFGWIPFEPTATLGSATEFEAQVVDTDTSDDETLPETEAEADETADTPDHLDDADEPGVDEAEGEATEPTESRGVNWVLAGVLFVFIVGLVPGAIRTTQRMRRTRASANGDALAGWHELTDTMLDLGIMPHEALTPRAIADLLHTTYYVSQDALDPLIAAVEQAAYAQSMPATGAGTAQLTLTPVMRDLRHSMGWGLWLKATMLPASLVRSKHA